MGAWNSCLCNPRPEDKTSDLDLFKDEQGNVICHPDDLHILEKKFKNGNVYHGQMDIRRNLRHGFGLYTYSGGAVYEGQWLNDKASGMGVFKHSESTYTGQWKNGHKNGYGEESWFGDGTVYKGQFTDGEKHGIGSYLWSDGSIYDGDFSHDEIQGKGHYRDADGEYYGQFLASANHGHGKYTAKDGSVFEGQWKNGEKCGHGILIWPDGRKYDGQWYKDQQHGQGEFTQRGDKLPKIVVHFWEGRKLTDKELKKNWEKWAKKNKEDDKILQDAQEKKK